MDGRMKMITTVFGLLTALVVLFGSLTDQGWLPSFVKEPVQDVIPGQQQGEPPPVAKVNSGNGGGSAPVTDGPAGGQQPGERQQPEDACIDGFVWREAVSDDHVCVTPETRSQAQEDNGQADSRRSETDDTYGPDTCVQGFVWREAVPDDLVCVTPETRDQTREDNSLAESRRVG